LLVALSFRRLLALVRFATAARRAALVSAAILLGRILAFFVVGQALIGVARFALSTLALLLRIQLLVVAFRPPGVRHILVLRARRTAALRLAARILPALLLTIQ